VFPFADRGDESVDQDTVMAGLLEALVDFGAGHPAHPIIEPGMSALIALSGNPDRRMTNLMTPDAWMAASERAG
jgi:hypothetical protein